MRPVFSSIALIACIQVASLTPAWAEAPAAPAAAGNDVVYLRNGGMLRGTVTEVKPGGSVTMALTTGQTATIEWSQVDRVERGGAPQVIPQLAPTTLVVPQRTAFVHVGSDRPVRLELQAEGKSEWAFVCTSPCDGNVPMDGKYRIAGDGVRASGDFTLAATPGNRIFLDVDPASKAGFVGGIVIVSAAPIVALVGLSFIAAGSIKGSAGSTTNVGLGLTFGGLAGTAAGVILIVTNARTKQTQSIEPVRAARVEPEWRDLTRESLLPAAPQQLLFPAVTF